jgi:hypothetical protein
MRANTLVLALCLAAAAPVACLRSHSSALYRPATAARAAVRLAAKKAKGAAKGGFGAKQEGKTGPTAKELLMQSSKMYLALDSVVTQGEEQTPVTQVVPNPNPRRPNPNLNPIPNPNPNPNSRGAGGREASRALTLTLTLTRLCLSSAHARGTRSSMDSSR